MVLQLGWWKIIIFNGVSRSENPCGLKSRYLTKSFVLHIFRQRCGEAVDIDLNRVPAFRFDEYLMTLSFSKTIYFVFNAWAIAGACSFDPSCKHGTSIEARFEGLMNRGIG